MEREPGESPSFKQSDDSRMCVRKLLRAGERATQTDEGMSTQSSIPTSETRNIHNLWVEYSEGSYFSSENN